MSRKEELLTKETFDKIQSGTVQELKEIVINSLRAARAQKELMKEDQKIQKLESDVKVLKSGYKDLIEMNEFAAELALSRLEAKELLK